MPGVYQSQAALEPTISTGSSSVLFCCSRAPLSDLHPLLPWTVWRHLCQDPKNLNQHRNQPLLPDHLRYCSVAHRCLFRNWLLFNCIDLDVIKNIIKIISSDNQRNYFILKYSLFVSFQHLPTYVHLSFQHTQRHYIKFTVQ